LNISVLRNLFSLRSFGAPSPTSRTHAPEKFGFDRTFLDDNCLILLHQPWDLELTLPGHMLINASKEPLRALSVKRAGL
jgi:hypothetical protein